MWPGARPSRRLWLRSVSHGGGPEEAGEFAGDGDGRDVARFAALAQALVEPVQAPLCAQGDLEHVVGLTGETLGERDTDAGRGR